MKVKASNKSKLTMNIRHWITSLFVFAVVLVVPVFSLYGFGHFFRGNDNRSGAALHVMMQRKVDETTLPPQLFQEPLISVTFDDGFESIYKAAMPLLQKYGIHTTQYIVGGTANNLDYVSWAQVAQMQRAGHEIACHSMTHPDLTTLDDASLDYQLRQCKAELTSRFGVISDFASPYGSANAHTLAAISQYYDSQRNTNGDPTNGVTDVDVNTADSFNRYNIIGVTVRHNTSVDELKKLVEYAKATNGWVVLTYHQADEGTGSQFGVDPSKLEAQFKYLSQTDVRIVTMHDALQTTRLQNVEY